MKRKLIRSDVDRIKLCPSTAATSILLWLLVAYGDQRQVLVQALCFHCSQLRPFRTDFHNFKAVPLSRCNSMANGENVPNESSGNNISTNNKDEYKPFFAEEANERTLSLQSSVERQQSRINTQDNSNRNDNDDNNNNNNNNNNNYETMATEKLLSSIKEQTLYVDVDKGKDIWFRHVGQHPSVSSYVAFAKWAEFDAKDVNLARNIYENMQNDLNPIDVMQPWVLKEWSTFGERQGSLDRAKIINQMVNEHKDPYSSQSRRERYNGMIPSGGDLESFGPTASNGKELVIERKRTNRSMEPHPPWTRPPNGALLQKDTSNVLQNDGMTTEEDGSSQFLEANEKKTLLKNRNSLFGFGSKMKQQQQQSDHGESGKMNKEKEEQRQYEVKEEAKAQTIGNRSYLGFGTPIVMMSEKKEDTVTQPKPSNNNNVKPRKRENNLGAPLGVAALMSAISLGVLLDVFPDVQGDAGMVSPIGGMSSRLAQYTQSVQEKVNNAGSDEERRELATFLQDQARTKLATIRDKVPRDMIIERNEVKLSHLKMDYLKQAQNSDPSKINLLSPYIPQSEEIDRIISEAKRFKAENVQSKLSKDVALGELRTKHMSKLDQLPTKIADRLPVNDVETDVTPVIWKEAEQTSVVSALSGIESMLMQLNGDMGTISVIERNERAMALALEALDLAQQAMRIAQKSTPPMSTSSTTKTVANSQGTIQPLKTESASTGEQVTSMKESSQGNEMYSSPVLDKTIISDKTTPLAENEDAKQNMPPLDQGSQQESIDNIPDNEKNILEEKGSPPVGDKTTATDNAGLPTEMQDKNKLMLTKDKSSAATTGIELEKVSPPVVDKPVANYETSQPAETKENKKQLPPVDEASPASTGSDIEKASLTIVNMEGPLRETRATEKPMPPLDQGSPASSSQVSEKVAPPPSAVSMDKTSQPGEAQDTKNSLPLTTREIENSSPPLVVGKNTEKPSAARDQDSAAVSSSEMKKGSSPDMDKAIDNDKTSQLGETQDTTQPMISPPSTIRDIENAPLPVVDKTNVIDKAGPLRDNEKATPPQVEGSVAPSSSTNEKISSPDVDKTVANDKTSQREETQDSMKTMPSPALSIREIEKRSMIEIDQMITNPKGEMDGIEKPIPPLDQGFRALSNRVIAMDPKPDVDKAITDEKTSLQMQMESEKSVSPVERKHPPFTIQAIETDVPSILEDRTIQKLVPERLAGKSSVETTNEGAVLADMSKMQENRQRIANALPLPPTLQSFGIEHEKVVSSSPDEPNKNMNFWGRNDDMVAVPQHERVPEAEGTQNEKFWPFQQDSEIPCVFASPIPVLTQNFDKTKDNGRILTDTKEALELTPETMQQNQNNVQEKRKLLDAATELLHLARAAVSAGTGEGSDKIDMLSPAVVDFTPESSEKHGKTIASSRPYIISKIAESLEEYQPTAPNEETSTVDAVEALRRKQEKAFSLKEEETCMVAESALPSPAEKFDAVDFIDETINLWMTSC